MNMYDEAIYFTTIEEFDGKVCSALAVLYDRVIFPLPDFLRSKNPWANELAEHCECTEFALESTEDLRTGSNPACRGLADEDLEFVTDDISDFAEPFFEFLGEYGLEKSDFKQLTDKSIVRAFDVINVFLTRELKNRKEDAPLIVSLSKTPYRLTNLAEKLAYALEIELEQTLIPRFEIVPGSRSFSRVREYCADMNSRDALRIELRDFCSERLPEIEKLESADDQKNAIIETVMQLRSKFIEFFRQMELLESKGLIKIKNDRNGSLLFMLKDRIRLNKIAPSLEFAPTGQKAAVDVEIQRTDYTRLLLEDDNIRRAVRNEHTWQYHLINLNQKLETASAEVKPMGTSPRYISWIKEHLLA